MRFSVEEGMPNNQVFGILEDEKHKLWCSTADRLVCFDPESEDFRSYDIKDGLQGNEFSNQACAKSYDGTLYFGGPNGFNAFKPNQIQDNKYTPKVVITGFELFNKPVKVSKDGLLTIAITELEEIELNYDQHSFSFEFAGLSYQLPERNQYAYMLEGIDDSWQYIGNRRKAYFTDVDPGEYTFRVKATNSDGVWNQEATEVKVTIKAPFWKTWWFWAFIIIVGSWSAYALYRQFQKKLRDRLGGLEEELATLKGRLNEQKQQLREQSDKLQETRVSLSQHQDMVLERDQELRKFNRDLHENLSYAERIQQSQLTPVSRFMSLFPKSFLVYEPKMKVGGDFYWVSTNYGADGYETVQQSPTVIAIGDCAGRSVSGALLSMVGMQMLDEIVNREGIYHAKKLVDKLSKSFGKALNYNQGNIFYGMDLALCSINWQARQLEFVGAMRNLICICNGELTVIKGDGYPIGMAEIDGVGQGFTRHVVPFVKPTMFYLFTDGFEDQIGGPEHRKFGFRRLKELLLSIHELPPEEQKQKLKSAFSEWKGKDTQIDDLCYIGFRLPEHAMM